MQRAKMFTFLANFKAIHINCKVDKLKLCKLNCICWSKHRHRHLTNAYHKHVIGVCLLRQSASEKQNHDAEAQKPLRIQCLLCELCHTMFFFFCYRRNNLLHAIASSSTFRGLFTWSRFTTCAKNNCLLYFLITHKSTRAENPMI